MNFPDGLPQSGFLRARRILSLQPGADGDGVWWQQGAIRAVGDAAELERRVPTRVPRFDLPTALVTPGFVDGHTHLGFWALNRRRVHLAGAATRAEALRRVALGAPEHGWIRGHGWDANRWETAPDRWALDGLTAGPAFFESVDVHAGWANTAGLLAAGIDRDTPDPPNGRIVRDASGEATGVLLEQAQELIPGVAPASGPGRRSTTRTAWCLTSPDRFPSSARPRLVGSAAFYLAQRRPVEVVGVSISPAQVRLADGFAFTERAAPGKRAVRQRRLHGAARGPRRVRPSVRHRILRARPLCDCVLRGGRPRPASGWVAGGDRRPTHRRPDRSPARRLQDRLARGKPGHGRRSRGDGRLRWLGSGRVLRPFGVPAARAAARPCGPRRAARASAGPWPVGMGRGPCRWGRPATLPSRPGCSNTACCASSTGRPSRAEGSAMGALSSPLGISSQRSRPQVGRNDVRRERRFPVGQELCRCRAGEHFRS